MLRGVTEPEANQIRHMLNAKINSTQRVTRKKKAVFSALIAPAGAASILKEGYVVSGSAIATQYTERYDCVLEKRKTKLRSVYLLKFQ